VIWLAILALAVIAMAPLAFGLRRTITARGRREAALALHRAQLVELDRDLAEGRIAAPEHVTGVLEVQRRILAVAEDREAPTAPAARGPLVVALVMIPVVAFALYIVGGVPWLPSVGDDPRIVAMREQARQEAALIPILRQKLATLDQHSEQARQGYVLLGGAEARRRDMGAAAEAWRTALGIRFDPTLAVETAEAITESQGRVTDEAAGLFRRALAEAPPDAPWRPMAEKRLAGVK